MSRSFSYMSVQTCNVENGPITITNGHLTCHSISDQPVSKVIIMGSKHLGAEPAISITSSNVTIELQDVNIKADAPFTSDHSNITLISSGTNRVQATQSGQAGIGCDGHSNITFMAVDSGSLTVQIVDDAAAIGTTAPGLCDRLQFTNSTYRTTSEMTAIGIGAGFAGASDTTVNKIVIEGGQYTLATARGTAIGAGPVGVLYVSSVRNITVLGGNITTTSQQGTAIEASYAYGGRNDLNCQLCIDNT